MLNLEMEEPGPAADCLPSTVALSPGERCQLSRCGPGSSPGGGSCQGSERKNTEWQLSLPGWGYLVTSGDVQV